MEDFKGKVAVVTGAASGIGLALVRKFAAEGMKVVMADLNEKALMDAAKKIEATGTETLALPTDVSRAEDVHALAKKTVSAFGAVHILCNNAGVIRGGVSWETPVEDYAWHLAVNTWGVIHGIQAFIPILIEQDVESVIVNTASQSGITCTPFSAAYCLSKHAVVALSECLYHEIALKGLKIQVAVLCPMAVVTNIDKAEYVRPDRFMLPPEADSSVAEMVKEALSLQLKKGISPEIMAEQTLQAIREKRFYIFSKAGDSEHWKENIITRLEDIRLERNPTFPKL